MKLPSADADWYVLRSRGGCELLAAQELHDGGFDAYVPQRRIKNFVRRQRLLINQHRPLMPGYLFLATEMGRPVDWGAIRDNKRMRHVGRPLRNAGGFALRVPGKLIVKINEDEIAGKFDETGATKRQNHAKLEERFAPGREFRIEEGPFIGFRALVEGVTASDRVKALVEIFGRMSTVEFDPEQLAAA